MRDIIHFQCCLSFSTPLPLPPSVISKSTNQIREARYCCVTPATQPPCSPATLDEVRSRIDQEFISYFKILYIFLLFSLFGRQGVRAGLYKNLSPIFFELDFMWSSCWGLICSCRQNNIHIHFSLVTSNQPPNFYLLGGKIFFFARTLDAPGT